MTTMSDGRMAESEPGAGEPATASGVSEVVVGVIGRAFGRRGEVFVEPLNGDPERFSGVRYLGVAVPGEPARRMEVLSSRILKGRPVLRFEGADDVSGAEALRRREIRMPESELEELAEDAFYFHELIGCRAESVSGEPLGEVAGVEEAGGGLLLVLRRPDGGESLVPFVEGICPEVDPAARRILMDPPEGLLGVNG